MWLGVVTLLPEMFSALERGVVGRAITEGRVELDFFNPRDFTGDKHRTVDDKPYGGGPGMVMMVEPLAQAVAAARSAARGAGKNPRVVYLSPAGRTFDQSVATAIDVDDGIGIGADVKRLNIVDEVRRCIEPYPVDIVRCVEGVELMIAIHLGVVCDVVGFVDVGVVGGLFAGFVGDGLGGTGVVVDDYFGGVGGVQAHQRLDG